MIKRVPTGIFAGWILVGFALLTLFGCAAPGKLLPAQNVHVFYYPWYANPATDGAWSHWNHQILPRPGGGGPTGQFNPPADIGANFYPAAGCYSSRDPELLATHLRQIRDMGVGVLCLSWWGRGSPADKTVEGIMEAADRHGLKVNFHLEPYGGRNATSTRADIRYILERYGGSNAMHRDPARGNRPMFYVYDSYLTPAHEWATVFDESSAGTIRGTDQDALVIALFVKQGDEAFVRDGHFDGFYTYFAVDGFTYGSTPKNWPAMAQWARENGKLFIPSVGPGYDDTRIRPWNGRNQRERNAGHYYDAMWQAAIDVRPAMVSITSFNEWHEGTQIEPAVPKVIDGYTYLDYGSRRPDYYLRRTRQWVSKFPR